jgi:hypothetical protein
MVYGRMGFVKKSRERRFHLARRKFLDLVVAGRVAPLHPDVQCEIEASVGNWSPPRDWRSPPKQQYQELE